MGDATHQAAKTARAALSLTEGRPDAYRTDIPIPLAVDDRIGFTLLYANAPLPQGNLNIRL